MPSRQPGRDPLPEPPQAEYNPLQMEGLRVADPVEQLLEEMVEETKPRSLNYGTSSYKQPQSILNGRVFQLGANVRF